MAVLVDTSVWVNHFRTPNAELSQLLLRDDVLIHPFVLAEIACGTPPQPRQQTLADLASLKQTAFVSMDELIEFIEREALFGQGCGVVDLTLLASTLITPGALLWTADQKLAGLAKRFGVQRPSLT
jgi:predicted nucleic acid-binding protein